MTDRMQVDISKNMTIHCNNCLNDDDGLDWFGSCSMCQAHIGKYYYFQGLKEDKRCKDGYRIVLSAESKLKDSNTTVKDLLGRIETEKQMKAQMPMFGGLNLESVYD